MRGRNEGRKGWGKKRLGEGSFSQDGPCKERNNQRKDWVKKGPMRRRAMWGKGWSEAPFSRINAFSATGLYGLFLTWGENKRGLIMCIRYYTLHDYPCPHIATRRHAWAASVLPMLMQNDPFHSRALIDWPHCPLPQLGPFTETFTFFPHSLIWLGCPRSECEIQSPKSTCTYCYKHLSQHGWQQQWYIWGWLYYNILIHCYSWELAWPAGPNYFFHEHLPLAGF